MSSYSYNSSNELTANSAASFTYDNNGNTLTKADSTGTRNYTWDFENRLTSVVLPGTGGTVTFKYDPFGRRIQKSFTQNATTTNYLYDGANVIQELDANGNALARYSHGLGYDAPLAMTRGGANSFYEQDGNDSVTSLSSSTGTLANTYTYDTFGILTASSGSLMNPFQYTARDFDPETGLRYYRMRYYDSNVGRFLNEDPLGFHGGDSNFYAYVVNSPTDLVDPLGLQHMPGGPQHPAPQPDGTVRCNAGPNRTQGDSCEVIMAKMVQIAITLASHVRWDWEHGGTKHSTTDLYSWQGAFRRCLEMFNKYCVKDCPKPNPNPGGPPNSQPPKPWWYFEWIPVIPRIPGGPPFMPSPCFYDPTRPGCPFDPGRNGPA